jgi:hypothetical protein
MSYAEKWKEYKRRRNILLLAMFSLFPLSWLISKIWNGAFHGVFILAWFITCIGLAVRLLCWKCPYCGKPFFISAWASFIFSPQCLHCGLPKWSDGFPEDE